MKAEEPQEGVKASELTHKELAAQELAIISSISYANLNPLVLSTTLTKTSRTGAAILKNGKTAVSLLTENHRQAVERLITTSEGPRLSAAGFKIERLEPSGLIFIADALAVFELEIVERVGLDNYTTIIGRVCQVHLPTSNRQAAPLIRYNRSWAAVDLNSVRQTIESDDYPV
jgi:flavin reductase (DIM6/NTAB) family NADH-FMN oxidoreductase RutF